jgi:hypothetical protein
MSNNEMISVSREVLKKWQRDLDACQKVIWLRGGFDPAYCKDAQDCIKEMDALLSKPTAKHQGEQCALIPIERSYDVRARMLIAFNTRKQEGGDNDDALEAAHKALLSFSPPPTLAH